MKNKKPAFDIDFRKEYPKLFKSDNGVIIELDADEYETTILDWEQNQIKAKLEYEAEQAKETQRQAILDRIGLTADDLWALGL